jgi:hypothetical protein
MDQVRRLVEKGDILNYDACVANQQIWGLASANKLPGDDAGLSQTRLGLCTNFFKNGFYRGGISAAIDDRKSVDANEWTPERRKQYIHIRDDIVANFRNNVVVLKTQAAPADLGYSGAAEQVDAAKSKVDTLTAKIAAEVSRLTSYATALQNKNGPELISEVSETEFKLRTLEKENKEYEKLAELRSEQATDVYNKYEGNYHSSMFGYMPLHPSSRSALLTTAIFFGLVALILIGIKAAKFLLQDSGIHTVVAPAVAASTSYLQRGVRARNAPRF